MSSRCETSAASRDSLITISAFQKLLSALDIAASVVDELSTIPTTKSPQLDASIDSYMASIKVKTKSKMLPSFYRPISRLIYNLGSVIFFRVGPGNTWNSSCSLAFGNKLQALCTQCLRVH
jgi:hypothetical protein